jgi:hypothetical protein
MTFSFAGRAAWFPAVVFMFPLARAAELSPGSASTSAAVTTAAGFRPLINPPIGQRKAAPAIAPASDEARNAIQRIRPL